MPVRLDTAPDALVPENSPETVKGTPLQTVFPENVPLTLLFETVPEATMVPEQFSSASLRPDAGSGIENALPLRVPDPERLAPGSSVTVPSGSITILLALNGAVLEKPFGAETVTVPEMR